MQYFSSNPVVLHDDERRGRNRGLRSNFELSKHIVVAENSWLSLDDVRPSVRRGNGFNKAPVKSGHHTIMTESFFWLIPTTRVVTIVTPGYMCIHRVESHHPKKMAYAVLVRHEKQFRW